MKMPVGPIRVSIPGLLDVLLVSDPVQIRWLNRSPDVSRRLDPDASPLHRFVVSRLAGDLGFHGATLPVFRARGDAARAERQAELEAQFNASPHTASPERDAIASYIAGVGTEEIGRQVQQWCGRLFFDEYRASDSSYEAGNRLAGWASAPPWRTWFDRWSGRLSRAKFEVECAANGDLACVHGTSIGMENVARTVRAMRELDKQIPRSAEQMLRECLHAPPAILRGCERELRAPFLGKPLTPRTLIVFLLARAVETSGELDVAFLADEWSRCPAHRAIRALLGSVWDAKRGHAHDSAVAVQGNNGCGSANRTTVEGTIS